MYCWIKRCSKQIIIGISQGISEIPSYYSISAIKDKDAFVAFTYNGDSVPDMNDILGPGKDFVTTLTRITGTGDQAMVVKQTRWHVVKVRQGSKIEGCVLIQQGQGFLSLQ